MEAPRLQATLFDFAITELVRQHRDSFQPAWTAECWSKLLIWLALNCGCSPEQAELEAFAQCLGPALTVRMRRLFFQRELEDLDLQLMADPAEQQLLALPLHPPQLQPGAGVAPDLEKLTIALERLGLMQLVAPRQRWQQLEGVVAVPWAAGGQQP
jgi:hypothetical protein